MVPPFLASRSRACPASARPREAMGRGSSRGPSWVPDISTYLLRSVTPALRLFQGPRAERQPQAQPQQQEHGGTGKRRDVRAGDSAGARAADAPRGQRRGLAAAEVHGPASPPPLSPAAPRAPPPARPAPPRVQAGSPLL